MKLALAAAAALALSAVACVAPRAEDEAAGASEQAIVAGEPASEYEEAALVDLGLSICSGAIVAPRVALTAGHCVTGSSFTVRAPYAGGQVARGVRAWTPYVATGDQVNPDALDVGVIVLDRPILLAQYPMLARAPVADGTPAINVGRIRDGQASHEGLFFGRAVRLSDGSAFGFPLAYESEEVVVQSGDSGGPVYVKSGATRRIIAVNSGAGEGLQIVARVDLAYDDLQRIIAETEGR